MMKNSRGVEHFRCPFNEICNFTPPKSTGWQLPHKKLQPGHSTNKHMRYLAFICYLVLMLTKYKIIFTIPSSELFNFHFKLCKRAPRTQLMSGNFVTLAHSIAQNYSYHLPSQHQHQWSLRNAKRMGRHCASGALFCLYCCLFGTHTHTSFGANICIEK